MPDTIQLTVVTPENTLFDDTVSEVILPAYDGYMGFLPRHAPMVSILGIGILTIRISEREDNVFCISGGGYFEISDDNMIILADTAEDVSKLDLDRVERARRRAMDRLTGKEPGQWDIDRARAALTRANNRLKAMNLIKYTEP